MNTKVFANLFKTLFKGCASVNGYLTMGNCAEMLYQTSSLDVICIYGICLNNRKNKPKDNGQLYKNITGYLGFLPTAEEVGPVLFTGKRSLRIFD
jgi:hypothetical protein